MVTDVVEDSRTGGPSISKRHYDYLEGGAWHHEPLRAATNARG